MAEKPLAGTTPRTNMPSQIAAKLRQVAAAIRSDEVGRPGPEVAAPLIRGAEAAEGLDPSEDQRVYALWLMSGILGDSDYFNIGERQLDLLYQLGRGQCLGYIDEVLDALVAAGVKDMYTASMEHEQRSLAQQASVEERVARFSAEAEKVPELEQKNKKLRKTIGEQRNRILELEDQVEHWHALATGVETANGSEARANDGDATAFVEEPEERSPKPVSAEAPAPKKPKAEDEEPVQLVSEPEPGTSAAAKAGMTGRAGTTFVRPPKK